MVWRVCAVPDVRLPHAVTGNGAVGRGGATASRLKGHRRVLVVCSNVVSATPSLAPASIDPATAVGVRGVGQGQVCS